jgi:hypothetical protein
VNDVTRLVRICRLHGGKATPESGRDAAREHRRYRVSPADVLDSGSCATHPQGSHSLSTTSAQSRSVVHMMWRLSPSARPYGVARESHTDL